MIIKSDGDRLLFLRYALPCAGTLVKRGKVTSEYIEGLVEQVSRNSAPKEDAEAMFKVANTMCDIVAERMGKQSTDAEVIRRYFLFEHSKVVDDRFELMRDFDPVDCRTYAGTVVKADGGSAVVETILGQRKYRTPFVKDLRAGDAVVVHFDFVVERVTAAVATEKRALDEKERR
jgi:hypothetical protein